ncbi:MAG: SPOR domain-containing protein [Bernardetiaceae bacterium]|nr:SPOR domain-containing protein [Bernardetiaceae bacterium]
MIEKYINLLLSENDEVVVPQVGTFVAGYAGSEIAGAEIEPPSKKILFYAKLKSDRSELLLNRMQEGEGISREEFAAQLDAFAERMNTALENDEVFEIEGVGKIRRNYEGELEFEQDEAQNFLTDAYGMPKLEEPPIAGLKDEEEQEEDEEQYAPLPIIQEEEEKEQETQNNQNSWFAQPETTENDGTDEQAKLYGPGSENAQNNEKQQEEETKSATSAGFAYQQAQTQSPPVASESSEETKNTEEENDDEKEEKKEDRTIYAWLFGIPIIFALLFIVYMFISEDSLVTFKSLFFTEKVEKVEKVEIPLPSEETASEDANSTNEDANNNDVDTDASASDADDNTANDAVADNANSNEANDAANDANEASANTAQENDGSLPAGVINEPRNRFYVVAGSFNEYANAQAFQQQVIQQGNSESKIVMYPRKGMYRVTLNDTATEREAYNARLQLIGGFGELWVLNY